MALELPKKTTNVKLFDVDLTRGVTRQDRAVTIPQRQSMTL